MVRSVILYNFYNLNNVKNTHGGVLLLVKLQAKAMLEASCRLIQKVTLLHGCFSRFFKLYKWYQTAQSITYDL